MTTDKDIKQLFDDFHPMDAKDDFVQQLDKKMQVVDIVRGEHNAVSRFYALFAAMCFVMGLIIGMGLLYVALFYPIDWTMLEAWHVNETIILFAIRYGHISLCLLASLIIVLGSLPWINSNSGLTFSKIRLTHHAA